MQAIFILRMSSIKWLDSIPQALGMAFEIALHHQLGISDVGIEKVKSRIRKVEQSKRAVRRASNKIDKKVRITS